MESINNRKRPGESEDEGEKRARMKRKRQSKKKRRNKWQEGGKTGQKERKRQSKKGIVCYSRDSSRESYQTEAQEYITTATSGRTES